MLAYCCQQIILLWHFTHTCVVCRSCTGRNSMEVRNEVDNLDECLRDDQLNIGMFFLFTAIHLLRSIASSVYLLDSPLWQPLSRSSLVSLFVLALYFILHAFLHPVIIWITSPLLTCYPLFHCIFCMFTQCSKKITAVLDLLLCCWLQPAHVWDHLWVFSSGTVTLFHLLVKK